jgi:hypothetical protein
LQEGKFEDAGMLREILNIQLRVLEPDNPETAISRYNLAYVAAHRGRRDEALGLLKEAVDHGLPPARATEASTTKTAISTCDLRE